MTVQIPSSHSDGVRGDGTHDHVYLGDNHDRNAKRTWFVIALTASMMVVEIVAGTIFGSMALVADGWHMCTHAAALMITAMAYYLAKRHAKKLSFQFWHRKTRRPCGIRQRRRIGLDCFFDRMGKPCPPRHPCADKLSPSDFRGRHWTHYKPGERLALERGSLPSSWTWAQSSQKKGT